MIKRILYVCILAFCVAAFSGCSDSDDPPDPLQEFKDSADALRDVFFYTQTAVIEGATVDDAIAREDLQFFDLFIRLAFNQIINFTVLTNSEGVYTNSDRTATITVSGSTHTFSRQTTTSLDGETSEVVQVEVSYNVNTDRWLIISYRGGTPTADPTEIWFKQEGELYSDNYYVATSFYIEEEEDLEADPVEYAPIHISNLIYEGTADAFTSLQMALERDDSCEQTCSITAATEIYPDGVVAAGNALWADFSIYNIDDGVPDFEIERP